MKNLVINLGIVLMYIPLTSMSYAFSSSPDIQLHKTKPSSNEGVKLGFIGFGTIASAIATGLLTQTQENISSVYVSRRSESKSSELSQKFQNCVHICEDNQFIVDNCDILFLCVLPEQEEEVLKSLKIGDDKILVSLVSTSKVETLIKNSGLPSENVYKMICLPAVAQLEGTPLLTPRSESNILHNLLSTLGGGTCVECENESIMESMMVTTCMMGPVYGLMKTNVDFLIRNGVPAKDASVVVGRQYWGMVKDALARSEDENSLDDLIKEQTPGGLNEQTLKNLQGKGFLKSYEEAMEAVLGRIRGETDGSINTK
mmetsp:Transcript_17605/g.20375  ORF Transcript_17605/g.20375 Transcript_17605/m.20375 type:complete len:315 (-) Transcript_17605:1077-2021(-)